MPSLQYINEKLSDAIFILTTHEGDARTRLAQILPKLILLTPSSFPNELQEDVKWIKSKIEQGIAYRNNLIDKNIPPPSKLIGIRNSTASKVIKKLLYVQYEINCKVENDLNK